MVSVSSYYLPSTAQVFSREQLSAVCSAILALHDAAAQSPSLETISKCSFLRIECECKKAYITLVYYPDITLGEVLNSLPLNIVYSPIKIPTNHGREQQKSVD